MSRLKLITFLFPISFLIFYIVFSLYAIKMGPDREEGVAMFFGLITFPLTYPMQYIVHALCPKLLNINGQYILAGMSGVMFYYLVGFFVSVLFKNITYKYNSNKSTTSNIREASKK
jgi:hypothetical protein